MHPPPEENTAGGGIMRDRRSKNVCKSQYINICFSEKDKELIAWANMVREDGQSINTWIQAVLLAEAVGENLDAGAVYVPKDKRRPPSSNVFGDYRQPSNTKKKPVSGWQIRGADGEFVAGSIISVRVTRPVMVGLIDSLHHSHKRIGPYAKAILRRKIRKLDSGPNIPPDESQIQDIFALADAHQQPKSKPPTKHRNASQQLGRNAQDGSSLPTDWIYKLMVFFLFFCCL